MSKSRKQKPTASPAPEDDGHDPAAEDGAPPKRVARHVQPVGPRVLVRIVDAPARLDSGLYLPANAKDSAADALLGEVLEVARTLPSQDPHDLDDDDDDDNGRRGDLGVNVSGIPLGARVLFGKERGVAIPWDDTLRLVDTRHVLALVDEISEDELQ